MKSTLLLLSVLALLLPSCVLGRRTINPSIPTASHAASKGAVTIGAVQDARVFENKPAQPSTPSVDGDHLSLSAEEKSRMVGRQRNGYGKAMGDIALPSSSSVPAKARELLAEAFARRGYTVANSSSNRADVQVQQFWAWFTPGMWVLDFEAAIQCQITITKGSSKRSFTVKGYGRNGGQVASNTNWNQAYERAFADFLTKLDAELQRAGL